MWQHFPRERKRRQCGVVLFALNSVAHQQSACHKVKLLPVSHKTRTKIASDKKKICQISNTKTETPLFHHRSLLKHFFYSPFTSLTSTSRTGTSARGLKTWSSGAASAGTWGLAGGASCCRGPCWGLTPGWSLRAASTTACGTWRQEGIGCCTAACPVWASH